MFNNKNFNDDFNLKNNYQPTDKDSKNSNKNIFTDSSETQDHNDLNFNKFNSNQINPGNLLKDYEAIKLCSINPNLKNKLEQEILESKEILQKINRLIDKY